MDGGPDEAMKTPRRVGERLQAARLARGLDLGEVAARTRVPQRHLEAIEASDYSGLPSITYAMGFAKAYARAVDEDEVAIARDLRSELAHDFDRAPPTPVYETSDPSRAPSRGVAIGAAILALLVLIGAGLWYGTGLFRGTTPPPETTPLVEASPTPTPSAGPEAAASPAPESGGQVTLTANDEVWLRVYDAKNDTLVMKTLKAGERYDVPAGADHPMINVGRPDKLTITVNGTRIPPLGDGKRPIKDVSLAPDALRARIGGGTATGGAAPVANGTGNSDANP